MIVRLALAAMGTRFELALAGEDESWLRAAGEEALDALREVEQRASRFSRDSLLSHVNRHAAAGPVSVDRDFLSLLALCRACRDATGGRFDPCVGAAMDHHGFHGETSGPRVHGPPSATFRDVALDEDACTVRFLDPRISLDLGGIAKGWGLDQAAECLREAGVRSALLHGGTSSVVAIGTPVDGDGFTVALRHPDGRVLGDVSLADLALSVSAPHGRTVERAGRVLGHVLDPSTGLPAGGARLAAVVGPSAAVADAFSTALLVAPDLPLPQPALDASHGTGTMSALVLRHDDTPILRGPARFRLRA